MVSTVAANRFTVELERARKTATMFRVPFDLEEASGRARPPVKEDVEWVEATKRPETRARRIAATVKRVREGRAPR